MYMGIIISLWQYNCTMYHMCCILIGKGDCNDLQVHTIVLQKELCKQHLEVIVGATERSYNLAEWIDRNCFNSNCCFCHRLYQYHWAHFNSRYHLQWTGYTVTSTAGCTYLVYHLSKQCNCNGHHPSKNRQCCNTTSIISIAILRHCQVTKMMAYQSSALLRH